MGPQPPISHSPTLPRLPEADHHLFSLYASLRLDIHALAEHSGRSMADLTAWAAAPEIRLWAEAYREIASHSLINSAIAALVETMKATENLVEKRRAAQAILRAHQTPRRPSVAAAPSSPSSSASGTASEIGGGPGVGKDTAASTARVPSATSHTPPPRNTPTPTCSPSVGPTPRGNEGSTSPTNAPRIAPHQHSVAAPTIPSPIHLPTPSPVHSSSLPPLHPTLSAFQVPLSTSTHRPSAPRSPISRLTAAAGAAGPAP